MDAEVVTFVRQVQSDNSEKREGVLDLLRHSHGRHGLEDPGDGLGDGSSHPVDLWFEGLGFRVEGSGVRGQS